MKYGIIAACQEKTYLIIAHEYFFDNFQ